MQQHDVALEIEQLLRRTMGLTAESVGSDVIHRSVRERMTICGAQNLLEYWVLLHGNSTELQELIEQVVIPETSFLRHPQAFAALANIVTTPGHHIPLDRTLRLLSAPCSTGEEAYSIAITLLEHGLGRDRFQIEAVDISHRSLSRAKHAVYTNNSFRGGDLSFRDQYFQTTTHGYMLAESIRTTVHFYHANLTNDGLSLRAEKDRYDVVFCRNLLIYLDRPAQERLMQTLHQLLTPDGYLFVGPSEAPLASDCGFHALDYPMAFAFSKSPHDPVRHGHTVASRQSSTSNLRVVPRLAQTETQPSSTLARVVGVHTGSPGTVPSSLYGSAHSTSVPEREDDERALLAQARELADAGRLADAARACEQVLRKYSISVDAHYLLALVCDALGDTPRAAAQYRKVLFLEPGHQDAVAQLAFLARARGDNLGAERLKARVRRIERNSQ
jgi:chemotaxis protein methyltransferase WspC